MTDRCHWVHTQDGRATLIPGCWSRVHDPEAECLCGVWSEDAAAEVIKGLRARLFREIHRAQQLQAALDQAGVQYPGSTRETPAQYTARRRRRALHKAITEAGMLT